jgi:excisionase family DNA binding protein
MKRARKPLADADLLTAGALLTSSEIARVLRVHPKHVYRLLRRGLPGRRVGGEWRFRADEVLDWSRQDQAARLSSTPRPTVVPLASGAASAVAASPPAASASGTSPPSLIAANGDVVIELLFERLRAAGPPLLGHIQAERGLGLELLARGEVLAAGCHGPIIPGVIGAERLAFIRLVDRQIGLVVRRGVRLRPLRQIGRSRLASRPETAGVRAHFDAALRREGLDPEATHASALLCGSHRDVVCAVARGEADVGIASVAWANRVGLDCLPFCRETYGLLVPARLLGDPRVVRLCEVCGSSAWRRALGAVAGYRARGTGSIAYASVSPRPQSPARKGARAGALGAPHAT